MAESTNSWTQPPQSRVQLTHSAPHSCSTPSTSAELPVFQGNSYPDSSTASLPTLQSCADQQGYWHPLVPTDNAGQEQQEKLPLLYQSEEFLRPASARLTGWKAFDNVFDMQGRKVAAIWYDVNRQATHRIEYDPVTGLKLRLIWFRQGKAVDSIEYEDGIAKSQTYYEQDGRTPKLRRYYGPGGHSISKETHYLKGKAVLEVRMGDCSFPT